MLKRIINKIRRLIFGKSESVLDILIKNGNIKVGKNSKIDGLSVNYFNLKKDKINIEIGDDCFINGVMNLLSENSEIKIGNRVFVGPDTNFFCYNKITLEDDIMFSWGCTLIDNNSHSLNWSERENDVLDWLKGPSFKNWDVVKIGDILIKSKSWIGFNSIISKNVVIEEGTIVASGSVVTKSSEPFSIIGGNPARIIKYTT